MSTGFFSRAAFRLAPPLLVLPPCPLADSFFFRDACARDAHFLVSLDLRNGERESRQGLIADAGAGDAGLSFGTAKDLGLIVTGANGA